MRIELRGVEQVGGLGSGAGWLCCAELIHRRGGLWQSRRLRQQPGGARCVCAAERHGGEKSSPCALPPCAADGLRRWHCGARGIDRAHVADTAHSRSSRAARNHDGCADLQLAGGARSVSRGAGRWNRCGHAYLLRPVISPTRDSVRPDPRTQRLSRVARGVWNHRSRRDGRVSSCASAPRISPVFPDPRYGTR